MEGREFSRFAPNENKDKRAELSPSSQLIEDYFKQHPVLMAISVDKARGMSAEQLQKIEQDYVKEWNACASIVVRTHDEGVSEEQRQMVNGRMETLRESRDALAEITGKRTEIWKEFSDEDLAKIAADNDARQDLIDRGHVSADKNRRVA
ncbi:MAG: hypothetical protein QG626_462 [Patescibacteria group bacterium]|jgi:hypothetical protein|nr:hypothetical protein [Patescibacteria group bacterium]